jgi:hypothetical protein
MMKVGHIGHPWSFWPHKIPDQPDIILITTPNTEIGMTPMPAVPPPPPAIHAPVPVSQGQQAPATLFNPTTAIHQLQQLGGGYNVAYYPAKPRRVLNQRQKRRDQKRFGYNRR